ncbi:hypothetical protein BG011_009576 [Mortierella polycephala]|uniref:Uncharacterized protein n=1 Tax=Mortierella polycephala TaxID=41804 RepID=A0A9P6TW17_9FUNG|nr:hypothetical protein BG011_009576 [Mortierella polycephala]
MPPKVSASMRTYSKKSPRQTGSVAQSQRPQIEDESKSSSLLADPGSYNIANYSISNSTSSRNQDSAVRVFDPIPKPYLGLQKQSNPDQGDIVELDSDFWASASAATTQTSPAATIKSTKKNQPKKTISTQPKELKNPPRKRGRPKKDKTIDSSSSVVTAASVKRDVVEETKVKPMTEPGVASFSLRCNDMPAAQSPFDNTSSDSRNESSVECARSALDNLLPGLTASCKSYDGGDESKNLKRRRPTADRPQKSTRAIVEKQDSSKRSKTTWARIDEEPLANTITDEELAEAGII